LGLGAWWRSHQPYVRFNQWNVWSQQSYIRSHQSCVRSHQPYVRFHQPYVRSHQLYVRFHQLYEHFSVTEQLKWQVEAKFKEFEANQPL
jgi:hypothetical protein